MSDNKYAKALTKGEPHSANWTRDEDIAERYMAGETLHAVGVRYGLSRMRVKQIVKKRGLWRKRPESDPKEYLGVNVTPETKDALRAAADERGISMSKLTSEALEAALKELM